MKRTPLEGTKKGVPGQLKINLVIHRWLVSNRHDGHNVNSWHWEECSKLQWSKNRLGELLPNTMAAVTPEVGTVRITGIKAVTGEVGKEFIRRYFKTNDMFPTHWLHFLQASISKRKGNKKLALFDLTVIMIWEGQAAGSNTLVGSFSENSFLFVCFCCVQCYNVTQFDF